MKRSITGHDLANTVKMSHTQWRIAFLLVEGPTDAALFKAFIHGSCELLVCHGRANALLATALLDEAREAGFLTFVDAEWDRVSGNQPTSPNCVWTDHHDLIVDLLWSPALSRVLTERGSPEKIAKFEKESGKTVLQTILDEAATLGRLRWHNESASLSLKFTGLEIHAYVDDEMLRVQVVDIMKVVIQRSAAKIPHTELHEHCERLAGGGFDSSQVASGHDAVAILSFGLRKQLGSQRAQDVRPEVLELELRLAFDAEALRATVFHAAIRNWEANNAGWQILA
jgi:hypothetical protein